MAYESHARMTRMFSTKLAKTTSATKLANPSQKFLDVIAVFEATGKWPSKDDPAHGKTIKIVNRGFPKRGIVGTAFTFDIYEMFKRRGYTVPETRLPTVIKALAILKAGHKLSTTLAIRLRDYHLSERISAEDIEALKKLNFNL